MAVYARGYRSYDGGFGGGPPALTIYREAFRSVRRRKAFKFFTICVVLWFSLCTIGLYIAVQINELARQRTQGLTLFDASWAAFRETMVTYYSGVTLLTGIFALFVGAPLVSDDLRTRALPLYLVRPIRPVDYVIGKALVIPVALLWFSFLPGVLLLLLMTSWQEPGESMAYLSSHADVIGIVARHTLIAAASYTGLLLFLSSRSSRRAAVVGLGAVAIFGGLMLNGLGVAVRRAFGDFGAVLRSLGLPLDSMAPIVRGLFPERVDHRDFHWLPPEGGPEIVAAVLLLLGLWSTWRRARTVEVTG